MTNQNNESRCVKCYTVLQYKEEINDGNCNVCKAFCNFLNTLKLHTNYNNHNRTILKC